MIFKFEQENITFLNFVKVPFYELFILWILNEFKVYIFFKCMSRYWVTCRICDYNVIIINMNNLQKVQKLTLNVNIGSSIWFYSYILSQTFDNVYKFFLSWHRNMYFRCHLIKENRVMINWLILNSRKYCVQYLSVQSRFERQCS